MPTWLPWLLLGLGLASVIGLVLYLVLGGEEEEDPDLAGADTLMITAAEGGLKDPLATTTEEYKSTARKSRMIALKESLERSLDSREGTAQISARDRMLMPWFMLVGADGSGKKTILANTGLALPWGPPLEVDSQRKDAGKWWLFEDAVVLEAPAAAPGTTPGTQTLPPGQTVADTSVGWNTLLHMLRRERPDSPLNGIIVTISCADLMGARVNPDRMEEQADRINNFLSKTRKFLGVRLPIHVLVTKCDILPGFRSFAEALPDSRRHDIFGWANPNDPESRFEPAWVDAGFTQLQQELADLRDEVLAAPEQVRDSVGVFVFDSEFSDLQEPLKAFVARLTTVGERRPSLFFRGFYFTGDALDTSETEKEAETTISEAKPGQTARISSEIAGEAHNLVFLRSLFRDKIFKEAGLARPYARLRLARDRRVVMAQAAAVIIAVVGGSGLWMSLNGVRRDQTYRPGLKDNAERLTRVLSGVAIDLDELRRGDRLGAASPLERRARDAAVIELVGQMRDVPSMRVRSAFIPSSWFSPLPAEIKESMMMGIQNIVLPVTRQRLAERAERLLSPPAASDSMMLDVLDPSDPRSLTEYLGEVRALSHNIARYNSIADSTSGSVRELSALLDYLFGEQIASDSALATQDFDDALVRAQGPRIAIAPNMAQTVVGRAVGMVAVVADRASQQLAPRATPAAERAIKPEEDLEALNGLAALVRLLDPQEGVVAKVTDQQILGMKLARAVEDSIASQFQRVAAHVVRDTISPDSSAKRLRNVIQRLYQYRLMDRTEARQVSSEIRPDERLRWDIGKLELALGLPGEFLHALVTVAEGFPGQSPDRFRRALQVQLRARALDVVASAQRYTPVPPTADPLLEVRSSGLNLEAAAPRLIRLSVLLDTLEAAREGRMLVGAGARQAERALATAQALYDQRLTYFAPQTAKIAVWQGVVPLSFAALGVSDTLSVGSMLIRHNTDVRTLAHDVIPAINYLRLPAVRDTLRLPGLLATWEAIVTASQRYERAEVNSTLGMLYRYVREGLSVSDLTSCTAAASESDTTKASTDPFVIRRRQFRAALVSRCGTGGAAEAVANYQKLRTLFQTRLAGRYPFADSTFTVRGEADPIAVREFFRQYDTFSIVDDVALRSHPTLSQTARLAIAFLDQMAQVRSFAAPYVENAVSRSATAYSLMVSQPQSDSVPTSQLELQVGSHSEFVDVAAQERLWRHGDSVKVILIPLDTSRVRTLFAAGGGWSAVRFAQTRPANLNVKFFHPDTKIELVLPVFPATAPEILIPRSR